MNQPVLFYLIVRSTQPAVQVWLSHAKVMIFVELLTNGITFKVRVTAPTFILIFNITFL